MQRTDDAGHGRRHLHDGLGGFNSHHGLVDRDAVTDRHVPAHDLRFLQSLTEIGQMESSHGSALHCSQHRIDDARSALGM